MAKKRGSLSGAQGISTKRANRLFRLVTLLARGSESRESLTRLLKVGMRDFYRDLKTLRKIGIEVVAVKGTYRLTVSAAKAAALLPFPDPKLTLGEAEALARGRSPIHRKLRAVIAQIKASVPPKTRPRKR